MVQYSLEYRVLGLPWEDAVVVTTNNTYMLIVRYEEAYIYEVRVSARNVFGFGAASKVRRIYFAGTLPVFNRHLPKKCILTVSAVLNNLDP